jgi:type IV pilus assembly protein PilW
MQPTVRGMDRFHAAKGFTLVDLLVSLAVLGLLLGGVVSVLRVGLSSYLWGAARVQAQQSARVALERMAKELREAGYDPAGIGIQPVLIAEPTLVLFQRDLNSNGVIDPTQEQVTFRLVGTVLRRNAGGGFQPIIEDVKSLVLTYFDRTGALATGPAEVASIRIDIEVGLTGPAATMSTQVTLRNYRG